MVNITNLINKDNVEIIYNRTGHIIKDNVDKTTDFLFGLELSTWYKIIILLVVLIALLLFKIYRNKIKDKVEIIKGSKGQIRVLFLQDNKHYKEKMIPLDRFGCFKINNKTFNLSNIENYIIGYKNNIPSILFDNKYVIPLMIREMNLKQQIIEDLGYNKDDLVNLDDEEKEYLKYKVKTIAMKIDSSVLHMVYSKKLMEDLYQASKESIFNKELIKYGAIAIGLYLMYANGYFEGFI